MAVFRIEKTRDYRFAAVIVPMDAPEHFAAVAADDDLGEAAVTAMVRKKTALQQVSQR